MLTLFIVINTSPFLNQLLELVKAKLVFSYMTMLIEDLNAFGFLFFPKTVPIAA